MSAFGIVEAFDVVEHIGSEQLERYREGLGRQLRVISNDIIDAEYVQIDKPKRLSKPHDDSEQSKLFIKKAREIEVEKKRSASDLLL